MAENINLSLFNEFFDSSPVDQERYLINLKNTEETKEFVTEAKNRISDLKDEIKKMSENGKKKKTADETIKIIEEILDYNKSAQRFFPLASEVDKGKSKPKVDNGKTEPKPEEGIAERTKLRRERIAEIEREEKKYKQFMV